MEIALNNQFPVTHVSALAFRFSFIKPGVSYSDQYLVELLPLIFVVARAAQLTAEPNTTTTNSSALTLPAAT